MAKKHTPPEEEFPLDLTTDERKILLGGIVFLHPDLEETVRKTPVGQPVMVTLYDLEFLAGSIAGEANHTKDKKFERKLDEIYEKVEFVTSVVKDTSVPRKTSVDYLWDLILDSDDYFDEAPPPKPRSKKSQPKKVPNFVLKLTSPKTSV